MDCHRFLPGFKRVPVKGSLYHIIYIYVYMYICIVKRLAFPAPQGTGQGGGVDMCGEELQLEGGGWGWRPGVTERAEI